MKTIKKSLLPLPVILSCKKYLLLLFVFMFSQYCLATPATGSRLPEDSIKPKILIISSYDAQSIKARKNKKELFAELVTTLQKELAAEIKSKTKYESVIISEIISTADIDNISVLSIIKEHHSIKTIVIKAFDIWFEQTGVEVIEEDDGKKRTASYDICSNVIYQLYDEETMKPEVETKYREHFTERSVASGFLAAGPDIVGKRKHAILLMKKNAQAFMQSAGAWVSF